MTGRNILGWMKKMYDRLLALLVLAVLLVSLLLLATQAQGLKKGQDKFDRDLQALTPRFEKAPAEGRGLLETAVGALTSPLQVDGWPLRLLTPEQRVRCVNCERPIPLAGKICVYCQKEQPPDPEAVTDKDQDGMLDEWEVKFSFNPLDSEDAKADTDQDGFTNKEEFDFKTDPRKANDHPPALAKVVVEKLEPISFRLIFKGVNRLENKVLFQVNLRSGAKTWWASLGEEIEGFKLAEYAEQTPDGPLLTLQRGDRKIPLIKGREVPRDEYKVTLRYTVDNTTIVSRVDSEFDLKGVKYKVIKVDMDATRVLINDPLRGIDVWIDRQLANSQAGPKADAGGR